MKTIQVQQMVSSYGNPVPNQFIIWTKKYVYFQSYSTIIAKLPNSDNPKKFTNKTILDKHFWDYSRTTLKYLKLFLCTTKSKREIEKDIKKGVYKTSNLN